MNFTRLNFKLPNFKLLMAGTLLAAAQCAHAGVIVGGSALLSSAELDELQTWLGHGEMTLTNIYTKHSGDAGYTFHAAADGKGPTFSIMRALASDGKSWKTIGGYNPVSWDSANDFHFTPDPADWKAFIFNLSDNVLKRQCNGGQTVDRLVDGPVFGTTPLGPDLAVTSGLSSVYSSGWSYGDGFHPATGLVGSDYQRSIVDGTVGAGNVEMGEMEVFSVTTAVPEPAQVTLLLAGLVVLFQRAGAARSPCKL